VSLTNTFLMGNFL